MKLNLRLAGVIGVASALTMMMSGPAAAAPEAMHAKNFAGYNAISSTGITSFTGSFSIPTVTCPATGSIVMSVSVGLAGDPASSLDFLWQAQCFNGSLSMPGAAAIFCPNAGGFCNPTAGVSVAPGDSIQLSMSENAATRTTTAKVTNSTDKQTASASLPALVSEPDINATTGICSGTCRGSTTPIPSFTPIKFGSLKFNGKILSSFSPTVFDMYNGTTLQVATSPIGATGSFTNTFKHV